jgi:hypothetical protein
MEVKESEIAQNGIVARYLFNPKDIKSSKTDIIDGVPTLTELKLKRKYGKFDRKMIKVEYES